MFNPKTPLNWDKIIGRILGSLVVLVFLSPFILLIGLNILSKHSCVLMKDTELNQAITEKVVEAVQSNNTQICNQLPPAVVLGTSCISRRGSWAIEEQTFAAQEICQKEYQKIKSAGDQILLNLYLDKKQNYCLLWQYSQIGENC